MRGLTLLLATALTGSYTFAATSAMVADRQALATRPEISTSAVAERVWYGGTLPPVTIEAPAPEGVPLAQETCPAPGTGAGARTAQRFPLERVI
jgi:hypothetical protein